MLVLGANDREPLNYNGGCIETLSGGKYTVLDGDYKLSPECREIGGDMLISTKTREIVGDVLVSGCAKGSYTGPIGAPGEWAVRYWNYGWASGNPDRFLLYPYIRPLRLEKQIVVPRLENFYLSSRHDHFFTVGNIIDDHPMMPGVRLRYEGLLNYHIWSFA